MIFVTVGTHGQPFTRLLDALGSLPGDQLVVQHGPAPAPAGVSRAVPFLSFPEMLEQLELADAVIMHAGVGSFLVAANAGHVPIVVPRLRRYGEHVDDHQLELVEQLELLGKVKLVEDVARLPEAVAGLPPRRAGDGGPPGPLQVAVRAALHGEQPPRAVTETT